MKKREVGQRGERIAADFLRQLGYRILETNCRRGRGEIDIVTEENGDLVFIEVRSRLGGEPGLPEESIGPRKSAALRRLAEAYLQAHPDRAFSCRLDVVAVNLGPSGLPLRVEHIQNAVTW
jgi:putative endonuclease